LDMNKTQERVKMLLKKRNMNRVKLAKEIGVSRMTLYRWENGIDEASRLGMNSLEATMTAMKIRVKN